MGDLEAVAVTYGPGLIGSLLVGVNLAKAIAVAHDLPLVGVNHIEGHIYANWRDRRARRRAHAAEPTFPLLCLVVGRGHTQLVLMHDHGRYELLGQTVDDAAARRSTRSGCSSCRIRGTGDLGRRRRPVSHPFPRARTDGAYDFSFSGLKTAVLREVEGYRARRGDPRRRAGCRVRGGGGRRARDEDRGRVPRPRRGGRGARWRRGREPRPARHHRRAAGRRRAATARPAARRNCTDNGAMIGAAAGFRLAAGDRGSADLEAMPNLALPWLVPA